MTISIRCRGILLDRKICREGRARSMNEIFRFMALRAPDTSDPSSVLDISNPKSPFQNLLTTERNRAIGQQTRRGDSSPRNLTVHGVPVRALRTVSLAAN